MSKWRECTVHQIGSIGRQQEVASKEVLNLKAYCMINISENCIYEQ
jgi:hypothetical protein